METSDYISFGALIFSGFAVYLAWKADKRAKDKDEVESKILLNLSCDYDFFNRNFIQIGEEHKIGQGLRFSIAIHNYGYKHAFLKTIFLMETDEYSIKRIYEFPLNNRTNRNIKSTEKQIIELYLTKKELTEIIASTESKKIFVRIITDGDFYFDSNIGKIKL